MLRVTSLIFILFVSVLFRTSSCQRRSAGPFRSRIFPGRFNSANSGIVENVVGVVGDTVGSVGNGINSLGNAAGGIVNALTRRLG
ncbi:unnamed protein product [Larinioides sclopetarius]|uniref:Uncharacterized protein n=1 Tax=Larinioides sclopetarius TaxID=280406 RepID=A0AAV2BP75_9ARAC